MLFAVKMGSIAGMENLMINETQEKAGETKRGLQNG
jgi:hypothetical protein